MIPILFGIFALITVGSAVMVVTRRNVFHAALFLILSFFGIAGLYVLLEAPFLAGAQLFIYVGGIAILIVIGIMLTQDMMNPNVAGANRQWWVALIAVVLLCGVMGWMVLAQPWETSSAAVPAGKESIVQLGQTLVDYQQLALPFEVASVLLLTALVGVVTIARER